MVKTATRAPAGKPAARATTPPAQEKGSPTKAQQAARHQGRAEEPQRTPATRAAEPQPKASVPAVPRSQVPASDFGSSASVPAFMKNDLGMGKENIGKDDIEIPRLKLIQGLSPELETYNDLKAGYYLHTASETIFDQPFRAVPIFMDRQFILWRPRDAGGGILARAPDGIHWQPGEGEFTVKLDKKDGGATVTWKMAKTVQQSGLANWGTMDPNDPNSPPAATLMYNFVLAFPDEPDLMPAVLTFQRSSIKMGRRFNTKLKTVRAPLFGCVFTFSSFDDSNGSGQGFKNVNVTGAGMVEDPALYDQYKAYHQSLAEKGLQIKDVDTLGDEDASGRNEADDEGGERTGPNKY